MFGKMNFLVISSEHIDEYGHVNYKSIAAILEPFQNDFLESRCTTFKKIELDYGLRSFVKKLEIVWFGQLRQGDRCHVSTELKLGETSMTFGQTILRESDGATLVTLGMVVVMVDKENKKAPIPTKLKEQLS